MVEKADDFSPTGNRPVPDVNAKGNIFAAYGPNIPEWRRIVRITGTNEGGFQTEVVQDYTLVKDISAAIDKMIANEKADGDDTTAQQQYLMAAWQSLALYLSSCDDEDKAGALVALKMVSGLMSEDGSIGPLPTETFGLINQIASGSDSTTYTCPMCAGRGFASEGGLINHLKTLHSAREHQPYPKNPKNGNDLPIEEQD